MAAAGLLCLGLWELFGDRSSRPTAQGERLGRGFAALRRDDGHVFLAWRFLVDDPEVTSFHLLRRPSGSGDNDWRPITAVPVRHGTSHLDEAAERGAAYDYGLQPLLGGVEGPIEAVASPADGQARPYLTVSLPDDILAESALPADLDGDGEYELLLTHASAATAADRPAGAGGGLLAVRQDGSVLWRAPGCRPAGCAGAVAAMTAYDLDGDGKAEVYALARSAESEAPWKLDAFSGDAFGRLASASLAVGEDGCPAWPVEAAGMAVAYLDGESPAVVCALGGPAGWQVTAFGAALEEVWRWHGAEGRPVPPGGWVCVRAGDVRGDGRDAVILGDCAVAADGEALWSLDGPPALGFDVALAEREGGPRVCRLAQGDGGGAVVSLVDAATGEVLWQRPVGPAGPEATCGFIATGDGEPGRAVWVGDPASGRLLLLSEDGDDLSVAEGVTGPLAALCWDALGAPVLADLRSGRGMAGLGQEIGQLWPVAPEPFEVLGAFDLLGDWREEIVVATPGRLCVHMATRPSPERRVTLMQDRFYRTGIARSHGGRPVAAREGGTRLRPPKPVFPW